MPKAETEGGSRDSNKAAADALAEEIATKAEPELARALSGGKTQVTSETAHRMAAAIARDSDRGIRRPMAEYIREANRR